MSAQHEAPARSRDAILADTTTPIPSSAALICAVLAGIGAAVFLFGLFTEVDRAWQALHVSWLLFSTISTAAVAFVCVQRITTARWSRPVIRFLEGYAAFLPVSWVLLALILLFGNHSIFPWTHEGHELEIPERAFYLNLAFLIPRDLIAYGILVVLGVWYIYRQVRLDVGVAPESGSSWARGLRERMRRGYGDERRELHTTHSRQGYLAVVYCFAFAYIMGMIGFDLSMAIDGHYFSTLHAWWFFMGGWLGALMSWALLTMWWRRHLNVYDLITESHFHDLGKLCFAFTTFWGYLTFGQYLIIWYGNLHEETHWFHLRLIQPWVWWTVITVVLTFVLPFFGLMTRATKVYLPTFALFAVSSLIGLWMLRYTEVYPSYYGPVPAIPFGLVEVGVALGVLGIWGLCYIAFMNAFPRMRVVLMTSPYRDEVQVPVDPETMEPLPAHE